MIAKLGQHEIVIPPALRDEATAADARALAEGYLCYASGCWRGDQRAPAFGKRLSAYWKPELPPMPAAGPDAISPHGGGGRGIYWFHQAGEVRGQVPGEPGGFEIPVAAIRDLVRCASLTRAGDRSDTVRTGA
jgi:hypothetical protein